MDTLASPSPFPSTSIVTHRTRFESRPGIRARALAEVPYLNIDLNLNPTHGRQKSPTPCSRILGSDGSVQSDACAGSCSHSRLPVYRHLTLSLPCRSQIGRYRVIEERVPEIFNSSLSDASARTHVSYLVEIFPLPDMHAPRSGYIHEIAIETCNAERRMPMLT